VALATGIAASLPGYSQSASERHRADPGCGWLRLGVLFRAVGAGSVEHDFVLCDHERHAVG
jgi:hypothetical protein